MYVCICFAVTEKEIAETIDQGADDVYAVSSSVGAGACCGSCQPVIQRMIDARIAELAVAAE